MKNNIILGTQPVAESAWGPPLFFRSARDAQSPRFRLPAASVLARGFRRCCLGRPWVLIRLLLVPDARPSRVVGPEMA